MNNIAAIAVNVEWDNSTENVLPEDNLNIRSVLLEIQHALELFFKNGDKYIIDLGAIPLTSMQRNQLFDLLGQGEVQIHLSSLGESEIYETNFSSVWVIKHRDEQDQYSSMFIEIAAVPDIVVSQRDDISESLVEFQDLINRL